MATIRLQGTPSSEQTLQQLTQLIRLDFADTDIADRPTVDHCRNRYRTRWRAAKRREGLLLLDVSPDLLVGDTALGEKILHRLCRATFVERDPNEMYAARSEAPV